MQESKAQLPVSSGKSFSVDSNLSIDWLPSGRRRELAALLFAVPLVGVIAGLGAVAFLVSLQFMYSRCPGGIAPLPYAAHG